MKRILSVVFALVLVLSLSLVTAAAVSAQENWGGNHATTVTLSWEECYTMYQPDGDLVGGPWCYDVTDVDFQKIPESETYRTTDMEAFMGGGTPAEDILGGFIMINRKGKLHGHVSYISGRPRGLPIYQVFQGQVTVTMTDGDTATMDGEYHDRVYVRGTEEEVMYYYPWASRIGRSNKWFMAYGDYDVSAL